MDHHLNWDPTTGEVKAIVDELRPLLEAMAQRDRERLERDDKSRSADRPTRRCGRASRDETAGARRTSVRPRGRLAGLGAGG